MTIFKILYVVIQFIFSIIYFLVLSVPLAFILLTFIFIVDIVKRAFKFFNKLLT